MQVAAVAILIFEREGKVSLHYKQGFISQEFSTPVCFIAEIRTTHGSGEQSVGLNGIYMGKKICQLFNHVISYPKWYGI